MTHIISSLLQINDPHIDFVDESAEKKKHKDTYAMFIDATLTYTPDTCPHCHCPNDAFNIVKNGTRRSRITLPFISGAPAFLNLRKQRFYCQSCQRSFTASTPIVEPHCHISNRVYQWIADQCQHKIPEQYMAQMTAVSTTTVRRGIEWTAKAIRVRPTDQLPEHLCFDEFKSVKSADAAMSFVCCDAETHQIVDIIEDRKQSSVIDYFLKFEPAVRRQVKTVTIDMYVPYINIIQHCFPNAKIIIDKFHLVQALQRELNVTRVKFMNQIRTPNQPLYNKLKHYWKLLLMRPEDLSRTDYKKMKLFKKWQCTHSIVQYLLDQDETLRAVYECVHALRRILKQGDILQLNQYIETLQKQPLSDGMKRVLRTFKTFSPYIEHTLEYPTLTNGPIEGINNSIKVLKRVAFGYRNFAHFRDRILLMTRLYQKPKHKKGIQTA